MSIWGVFWDKYVKNMTMEKGSKNGGGKGSATKRLLGPLKRRESSTPSSAEACRFLIESSTLCVPLRHGGG